MSHPASHELHHRAGPEGTIKKAPVKLAACGRPAARPGPAPAAPRLTRVQEWVQPAPRARVPCMREQAVGKGPQLRVAAVAPTEGQPAATCEHARRRARPRLATQGLQAATCVASNTNNSNIARNMAAACCVRWPKRHPPKNKTHTPLTHAVPPRLPQRVGLLRAG